MILTTLGFVACTIHKTRLSRCFHLAFVPTGLFYCHCAKENGKLDHMHRIVWMIQLPKIGIQFLQLNYLGYHKAGTTVGLFSGIVIGNCTSLVDN